MENILEKVIEVLKEAGRLLENRKEAETVKEKGLADYVTQVDVKVQEYLYRNLKQIAPHIEFLGEEAAAQVDFSKDVWVLDPVDGTTNLIHDYKHSAISLALIKGNQVIMGIVYDPYRKELFTAQKGKGAYLNGAPVHVSRHTKMGESLISIGTSPYYKELAEENFRIFKQIFIDIQDIRRSGSAALDLAYAACGRIDGYFERNLKIWDYAAGMLLVQEAGGTVTDYAGNRLEVQNMADVIAGNRAVASILAKQYLLNTVEGEKTDSISKAVQS